MAEQFGAATYDDLRDRVEAARDGAYRDAVDAYYDDLGIDLDAARLDAMLERNGLAADSDITFVVPRQVPARTVEQYGMRTVAAATGDRLVEDGVVDDYSVTTVPLTDRMYSRNPEKRGYAYPVVLGQDGIETATVTDPMDGYLLDTHDATTDTLPLGNGTTSGSLRDVHHALLEDGAAVGTRLDAVHSDLLQQMVRSGQPPEMVGTADDTGKAVALKYDPGTGVYRSRDGGITAQPGDLVDDAVLPGPANYRTLVYPYTLTGSVVHILRGLEPKFRQDRGEQLRDEVGGLPVMDIGDAPYQEAAPDRVVDAVLDTRFGAPYDEDDAADVLLNTYPSDGLLPGRPVPDRFPDAAAAIAEDIFSQVEP